MADTTTSSQTRNTEAVTLTLGTAKLIQGPKGNKGDKGDSAYVLAQQGGYEGTEAQFATAMAALPEQAEDAKENAEAAAASAVEAAEIAAESQESKGAAEAWASGTIDGVPVPSTHEAYDNNAKYYASRAKAIVGGDYISREEAGAVINSMFAPIQAATSAAQNKADSAVAAAGEAQVTADEANTAVATHAGNGEIHVTAAEKAKWNAGGGFYTLFEPEEWTGTADTPKELRIPQSKHGMTPDSTAVVYTLRHRVGRNTRDYDADDNIETLRTTIIAMQSAALNANTATEGTFPVAEDGHAILTWETVQIYLLEGTLLAADAAATHATEKHINWKERDTLGVEITVTLDQVMAAAYLPALGAPATNFNALLTLEVIQGLKFRRIERGMTASDIDLYDMDGEFIRTWATMESVVTWDMATSDLVVKCDSAFAGDIKVLK